MVKDREFPKLVDARNRFMFEGYVLKMAFKGRAILQGKLRGENRSYRVAAILSGEDTTQEHVAYDLFERQVRRGGKVREQKICTLHSVEDVAELFA